MKLLNLGSDNIIDLLKKDHRLVEKILEQGEATTTRATKRRIELLEKLKSELKLHEKVEETIFYPRLKKHSETKALTLEAYEEHLVVDRILTDISKVKPNEERWIAKFKVLAENLRHHIKEEESMLFPKAEGIYDKDTLKEMGKKMLILKKKSS